MAENKEINSKLENLNSKTETLRQAQDKPEHGMTDLRERTGNVPKEIKSWMEKIEEDPGMANPINDTNGTQILTPTPPQNPKITLPVTRTSFLAGFKKSFDDAGRWLSTFLLRMIKRKDGNVKFKEE